MSSEPVGWKHRISNLLGLSALPGWIGALWKILWKLVGWVGNIDVVRSHSSGWTLPHITSPLLNIGLPVLGFLWLGVLVLWGDKLSLKHPSTQNKLTFGGEVYRAIPSPQCGDLTYKLMTGIYRTSDKGDFKCDFDILVQAYIVNVSTIKGFIRTFVLEIELGGKNETLSVVDNFRTTMVNEPVEYGLARPDGREPDKLVNLCDYIHAEMHPGMPIEGWLRFVAKDTDDKEVSGKPVRLSVIDSLGARHPIVNAPTKKQDRELELRRIRN